MDREAILSFPIEHDIREDLENGPFSIIPPAEIMFRSPEMWASFQSLRRTYDDLPVDLHMKAGETFRERRFGRFAFADGQLHVLEPAPYVPKYGGNTQYIPEPRTFEEFHGATYHNLFLRAFIKNIIQQLPHQLVNTDQPLEIKVQQIRIKATSQEPGFPTPEAVHRDGHDCVCIVLMGRENVAGGESLLYDNAYNLIEQVTMTEPLHTIILDDMHAYHEVTPISLRDVQKAGCRDVLIVNIDGNPGIEIPSQVINLEDVDWGVLGLVGVTRSTRNLVSSNM